MIPTERECTAYHEAGHAVVAHKLGVKIYRVTIVPAQNYLGRCELRSMLFDGGLCEQANLERAIQISLAGPLAQKRFHRRSYRRSCGRRDYYRASGLARYLAESNEREFLKDQELLTEMLIQRWWVDIERIASALLEHDNLTGADVEAELDMYVDQSEVDDQLACFGLEPEMYADFDEDVF